MPWQDSTTAWAAKRGERGGACAPKLQGSQWQRLPRLNAVGLSAWAMPKHQQWPHHSCHRPPNEAHTMALPDGPHGPGSLPSNARQEGGPMPPSHQLPWPISQNENASPKHQSKRASLDHQIGHQSHAGPCKRAPETTAHAKCARFMLG